MEDVGACQEEADFLALPDEIWTRILRFVDPEDLLALDDVSPRFASVTSDREVVGKVRFGAETLSDEVLGRFVRAPRAAAISELDLTNCVLPYSATVEQALGRCANLTALRCVNCRLSSRALFSLVLSRLPKLELLHWSLLGCRDGRDEATPALQVLDGNNNRRMSSIRSMYVELVESSIHVHTLCRLLPRCPHLRTLHVHVLGSCDDCTSGAPTAYGDRPLTELESFTYTTDAARGRCPYASRSAFIESRELWHLLLGSDEPLVQACVHLSELLPACDPSPAESMRQLCVTVDEPYHLSAAAARTDRWSSLDSLTLLSPLPLNRPTFPPGVGALYEAPLRSLFSACQALRELNLSRFHFTPDLSCCAVLAACLRHLRALSLPACALADPNSLEDSVPGQLRLAHLGRRGLCCYAQGLGTVLAAHAASLRVLKMEHAALMLGSHLLLDQLTKASSLELLCLTTNAQLPPSDRRQLLDTLLPRLPRLQALHVHAPGLRPLTQRPPRPRIHFDGSNGENASPSIVFTNELSILCRASNFIGLAKPYNRQPQPMVGEEVVALKG
ncbi:hypothetical protein HPB48_011973 [Haemaphysalis longicornis]|uniref:F-box domain-containing protein n=1 Tax=Haemaphysalis longicornis TaxID=44386 RepID=A0A9J6H3W4_HAELO|nr:hypothetical protein HPB48_011973 [Haemaphysalis longicornis]